MGFVITCDNGVCNNLKSNKDLDKIRAWHHQKIIEIQVTDSIFADILGDKIRSLEELTGISKDYANKRTQITKKYKINHGGLVLGSKSLGVLGINKAGTENQFEEIKRILFGSNYNEEKHFLDVRHLALHLNSGNDFFITLDEKDIISKKDELIDIGINPKTPLEFIQFLENHLNSKK